MPCISTNRDLDLLPLQHKDVRRLEVVRSTTEHRWDPFCDLNSAFFVEECLGLTVPSMRTPPSGSGLYAATHGGEYQIPFRHLATVQDEHQPPTPAKKVRGTQHMPHVLLQCGPRPRVLGMEGVHNASANRGVSLVDHPYSQSTLQRKRVLEPKAAKLVISQFHAGRATPKKVAEAFPE